MERDLFAKSNAEVWDAPDFVVVTECIRLDASGERFFKTGRLRIFTEGQLIRAIHIFDPSPQVLSPDA